MANSLHQGFIYHFLNQGDVDDAYIVQAVWQYKGKLDLETLYESWSLAQKKYPSLRLRFKWEEELVQKIDKEGKITGLDIVGSQETPGLGSKINNQDWKNLWVGRDSQYKFNKSVDAFAGATISPECTYNGIVKVLTAYEKEVK